MNFSVTGPNLPPVIGLFTANPTTVTSSSGTTTLSASATGSGPLTYSWDAIAAAGPVNFSANDSSATLATVSFMVPGSYTFRARVTDVNGFSTTATVGVTVSAGPGSMAVTPYQAQVAGGQTVQFSADGWDELGNLISVSPTWNVSGGGTINAAGLFTATTPGGPFAVTATSGGLSATGFVWVTSGTVAQAPLITTPPQSQWVAAGSNVTFNVVASGTTPFTYQWSLRGTPISGATVSSYTRTNVQSADAGSYTVVVGNVVTNVTSVAAVLTVNNPPVLAAIPKQSVHAGATLTVTNSATDLDSATQTLTYTLDTAPSGATIGSSSGIFVWSPTPAQTNNPYNVTVRVTDSGNPPLTDAKSFAITVVPPLTIVLSSVSGTNIVLTWNSISNTTYRVQYKGALDNSPWNALTPDVTATGSTASAIDSIGAGQRFYRILLVN
jgi:hypothetical protein